jgi:RNA polymerase sigma-70 factor (ECF subfamily)
MEMNDTFDAGMLQEQTRTLYTYALKKLRDPTLAEDLVQETFVAALGSAGERFGGRSSVRTWLVGILKHKVMDAFRERAKAPVSYDDAIQASSTDRAASDLDTEGASDGLLDTLPAESTPEAAFVRKRFLQSCQRHLDSMPKQAASVFVLSDVLGHGTEEVCAMLGISKANLWTTLHRARRSLRSAVEAAGAV